MALQIVLGPMIVALSEPPQYFPREVFKFSRVLVGREHDENDASEEGEEEE